MSLAVIIPARDEEALIARCLTSVLEAARHVLVHVDIQVVADGCLDSTVPIARTFTWMLPSTSRTRSVSPSRRPRLTLLD